MNELFSAILNRHEADDDAQIREEARILTAIRREFSNSEELLKEAKMRHITIRDVKEGRAADFPITPVRQSEEFYLKKHTESQIPYFHGHRFSN